MWGRWIRQQAAQTANKRPMFAGADGQLAHRRGTQIATVAIARGLLARCFHILIQLEAAPEKARPGALLTPQAPAPRPPGLTEQYGPDAIIMPIPTSGARMGACQTNSVAIIQAFSPTILRRSSPASRSFLPQGAPP